MRLITRLSGDTEATDMSLVVLDELLWFMASMFSALSYDPFASNKRGGEDYEANRAIRLICSKYTTVSQKWGLQHRLIVG